MCQEVSRGVERRRHASAGAVNLLQAPGGVQKSDTAQQPRPVRIHLVCELLRRLRGESVNPHRRRHRRIRSLLGRTQSEALAFD
eukprot:2911741-Pleurochrysis_carterae.AAC.1